MHQKSCFQQLSSVFGIKCNSFLFFVFFSPKYPLGSLLVFWCFLYTPRSTSFTIFYLFVFFIKRVDLFLNFLPYFCKFMKFNKKYDGTHMCTCVDIHLPLNGVTKTNNQIRILSGSHMILLFFAISLVLIVADADGENFIN